MRLSSTPFVVSLLFSATLLVSSCETDPADPGSGAEPPLPPLSSMQVDLSFFAAAGASEAPSLVGSGVKLNYFNAGIRVLLINTATVVLMAVPVAVFGGALQNTARRRDSKWHWEYTVNHQGNTFSADLAGWVQGSQTMWEMFITAPGHNPPLSDFLWYTGDAEIGNGSGTWHVFDALGGNPGVEVLLIDWTYLSEDDATLTFTATKPGIPENGDQLTFRVNQQERSITYFDASSGTTGEIWWNAVTGEGWMDAPDYNGGQRACWDGEQEDRECP